MKRNANVRFPTYFRTWPQRVLSTTRVDSTHAWAPSSWQTWTVKWELR